MSSKYSSLKLLLLFSFGVILTVITLLSLLPPKSTINLGNQDKISHYIAYFFLTINALLITQNRKQVITILLVILYGIIIECLQSFVPGRFPSYNDVIANSLGTLSGLVIILIGLKRFKQNDSLGA